MANADGNLLCGKIHYERASQRQQNNLPAVFVWVPGAYFPLKYFAAKEIIKLPLPGFPWENSLTVEGVK